ncbi:MAG: SMI1/KNR4 family protein [Leptolyngbyaceae cyanobacterium bins.302]|nr:SMI1/KNR4 family protein [Leptolyngbyaceae cyanobacterium bins.302]
MKIQLPPDYLAYVASGGSDAALTNDEPGYFQLWDLGEIESINAEYKVPDYAPGYLGFGSDGCGEMLAFDRTGAVFKIPFVGMHPDVAENIADSWQEIEKRITDNEGA